MHATALIENLPLQRSPCVRVSETGKDDFGAPESGVWDPLGLLYGADQARFDRLRYVEVKHGRIAQLAFLGHVWVSNGNHFGGYLSPSAGLAFADVKPGLAAFENLPPLATFQMVLFIGWLEVFVMRDVTGTSEFPGDFRNGFIDFGWDTFDEQARLKKRATELNNQLSTTRPRRTDAHPFRLTGSDWSTEHKPSCSLIDGLFV